MMRMMQTPNLEPPSLTGAALSIVLAMGNLVTVVFVILKMAGVIEWPWLVCLSPTLVPLGFVGVLLVILFAVLAVLKFSIVMEYRRMAKAGKEEE